MLSVSSNYVSAYHFSALSSFFGSSGFASTVSPIAGTYTASLSTNTVVILAHTAAAVDSAHRNTPSSQNPS